MLHSPAMFVEQRSLISSTYVYSGLEISHIRTRHVLHIYDYKPCTLKLSVYVKQHAWLHYYIVCTTAPLRNRAL